MYQRLGNTSNYTLFQPAQISSITNRQRGNSFEVPVLGKYYFRPRSSGWQPFLGTGYAFRKIDVRSDVSEFSSDPLGATRLRVSRGDNNFGVDIGAMAAAGLRFRVGRLAFVPEVRYTRWSRSDSGVSRQNEAGLLLGITF